MASSCLLPAGPIGRSRRFVLEVRMPTDRTRYLVEIGGCVEDPNDSDDSHYIVVGLKHPRCDPRLDCARNVWAIKETSDTREAHCKHNEASDQLKWGKVYREEYRAGAVRKKTRSWHGCLLIHINVEFRVRRQGALATVRATL
jgi:hypothetical protein